MNNADYKRLNGFVLCRFHPLSLFDHINYHHNICIIKTLAELCFLSELCQFPVLLPALRGCLPPRSAPLLKFNVLITWCANAAARGINRRLPHITPGYWSIIQAFLCKAFGWLIKVGRQKNLHSHLILDDRSKFEEPFFSKNIAFYGHMLLGSVVERVSRKRTWIIEWKHLSTTLIFVGEDRLF